MSKSGNSGGNAGLFNDLEAECQGFQAFCEILEAEARALTAGEIDKLGHLAQLKSDKVVQLSRLAERRNRILAAQALGSDRQGMARWIELHAADGNGDAGETWRRLLEIAERARRLNDQNGAMIEAKLRHNQKALAVFQSAATQLDLYGPDGKTRNGTSIRPIDKV